MHSPSVPVTPFYEPEGPPQALPLLMYHTEMFCPTITSISISWQEEIVFFPHSLPRRTATPLHVFTTPSHAVTPILSSMPTPKVAKAVSFSAEQISQVSIGSSLSSIASHESKIPKPDGEAGCPSHGGYNLEIALKWDASHFKVFKECIHASIQKHCDTSKSKTYQTPSAIIAVQTEMSHLTSYLFLDGADDDPTTPAVESYPLNKLCPAVALHMYPPWPVISASLDPRTSPPSPATLLGKEFGMDLFDNPWGIAHRKRDDNDQPPNKIFLKEVNQLSRLWDDVCELNFSKPNLLLCKQQIQTNANSQESNLRSIIMQYQEHQEVLEHGKADALASLNENHHNELTDFQIPDTSSDSDRDEGSQTCIRGAVPPLTLLLSDVPIQNATIGMLVEALAKVLQQTASPRAAQSKLKTHETHIENFTDAQC
ncbi:uncharacterized protein BJ212DRAFT_1486920 [Suillus subaureus]|uniref:Uncharacterized protein n=1 Tax=Suillus subaureus TaxID=48587 RepID=A0A9P7DV70_9AGAM|nr:uncharacterized protein BJ212DRAFT_1486920 [Suillus subaureus]KAG1803959.1 hypothetical protein BJ212DRAFT_1486920 [Suillus subaureus]